MTVKTITLWT